MLRLLTRCCGGRRAAPILVTCFLLAPGAVWADSFSNPAAGTQIDYGMPERLGATWRRCRARLGALLIFAALTRREELYKDFIEEASSYMWTGLSMRLRTSPSLLGSIQ
jgi:hypothetical protein